MPYPTIRQYCDVLQLPQGQRPLKSPELDGVCRGEIVASKNQRFLHWGSGSFATVFKCREGAAAHVAVRCLLSPPPDDATERCNALEDYRQQHEPETPYLVRSQFVPNAIKVLGEWHPVFLMDWIEGSTLGAHVEHLVGLNDTRTLSVLADKWQELVASMERLRIAHGDLQHGNIMVDRRGELRLVDYDTVFVPALASRDAVAIGTPGYVHPSHLSSGQRPYNDSMDKFGALVILLSLRALAFNPTLYGQFTQDNLLLGANDLEHPNASLAFWQLEKSQDREVIQLAEWLREACRDRQEPTIPTYLPHTYECGEAIPRQNSSKRRDYSVSEAMRRTASTPDTDNYVPSGAIPRA